VGVLAPATVGKVGLLALVDRHADGEPGRGQHQHQDLEFGEGARIETRHVHGSDQREPRWERRTAAEQRKVRPTAIAGVVLNDIGPVIEPRALLQLKGHVGKLPVPRNFRDGGEILRKLFGARFPKLTPQDWIAFAQRTWREDGGALVLDYDVRLARMLEANLEHSPPTLWDEFDALAHVPLMVIRGANSTMLTSATLDGMLERRGEIDMVVVPNQGHVPLLEEPKLVRRIATFVASCDVPNSESCDVPNSEMPAFSTPTEGPPVVPEISSDRLPEQLTA